MKLKRKPVNKIILGNCMDFLPTVPDNSVDLILIDPPYIISRDSGYIHNSSDKVDYIKKYGKHKIDFGDWDKTPLELDFLMSNFYRILRTGGTLISFYDVWKIQEFSESACNHKFVQPRVGIWQKTNPVPVNSKLNYLTNSREYFVTFVKGKNPTFNSEYDNGVYTIPILHGKERVSPTHPTQKPLSLITELINKHSNLGDTVLDCFSGTGTTGEACILTGRKFIICEADKHWYNVGLERISKYNIKYTGECIK